MSTVNSSPATHPIIDTCSAPDDQRQKIQQACPTSRGVTLAMLIRDGIIHPQKSILSIDYLGRKFVADLLEDGRIYWPEGNEEFGSPSAWAVFCKRLSNPDSKSGCGWASVKYAGKKLDSWKTTWYKRTHQQGISDEAGTMPTNTHGEFTGSADLDDIRHLPAINAFNGYDDVDNHQIIEMIKLDNCSQQSQIYSLQIDSCIPFLLYLFTIKGHDINGFILGNINKPNQINGFRIVILSSDQWANEIRARIINNCSDKTLVGWFTTHHDYVDCGPSAYEVKMHSLFQQALSPFFGMVFNISHTQLTAEFRNYFTVRPDNCDWDIPVELPCTFSSELDNFDENLNEFATHFQLPNMSLNDCQELLKRSPVLSEIPNVEKLFEAYLKAATSTTTE
ncbi:hypothetical protein GJ496_006017 [Pomphorhynchus laevis]|nr:hypothetical protein GJ496_006017 [Pomphorhynchus laevis]